MGSSNLVIFLILTVTAITFSGCGAPDFKRKYADLSHRNILTLAEEALAKDNFSTTERDYSEGRITAVSTNKVTRAFFPREEQWTVVLSAKNSEKDFNLVVLCGWVEIAERGALASSPWQVRDTKNDDKWRINGWLRNLDTAVANKGGTWE